MTGPKKSPGQSARSRGRPRKALTDKAEQFSVRLTPIDKIALEVYARAHNISLSQAVERAVQLVTHGADENGVSHADRARTVQERAASIGFSMFKPESELTEADIHEAGEVVHFLLSDPNGKLLVMPEETLTPEEKYFVRVVEEIGPIKAIPALRLVRLKSEFAFQTKMSMNDLVASLRKQLDK